MRRQFEYGTSVRTHEQRRSLVARGIAVLLGLDLLIAGVDLASQDKPVVPQAVQIQPTAIPTPHAELTPQPKPHRTPKPTHKAILKPHATPRPAPSPESHKPSIEYGPISFAEFRADPYKYLKKLPTLAELQKQFPERYSPQAVQAERAYIAKLKAEVHPTVDDYRHFTLNKSYDQAFASHPYYKNDANMQLIGFHWTAEDHDLTPSELAYKMLHQVDAKGRPSRTSVAVYDDHQPKPGAWQMIETMSHETATTQGANGFSQSIEIAAQGSNEHSPLFDITPEQVTIAVMAAVKLLRQNDLQVEAWRELDHTEMDLLFNNDDFSPATGRFAPGAELRKSDLEPGFMSEVVIPQSLRLSAELDVAGINY